jgi:hypothetical protein
MLDGVMLVTVLCGGSHRPFVNVRFSRRPTVGNFRGSCAFEAQPDLGGYPCIRSTGDACSAPAQYCC